MLSVLWAELIEHGHVVVLVLDSRSICVLNQLFLGNSSG